MSDANNDKFLDLFPGWLRTLGEDALEMSKVLEGVESEDGRAFCISGLNYIFKSLDLIPDGIDDLGYLDDAFVFRVAADLAKKEGGATGALVDRLSADCEPLREFLKGDYERLESYVRTLRRGAARGRTVDDVLQDSGTRAAFLGEVVEWSRDYQVPSFTRDARTLIKLRSFLSAKLP